MTCEMFLPRASLKSLKAVEVTTNPCVIYLFTVILCFTSFSAWEIREGESDMGLNFLSESLLLVHNSTYRMRTPDR